MKKILILLLGLFLYGCTDTGRLVEYKAVILLDKEITHGRHETSYYFKFFLDGKLYIVEVDSKTFNRYEERDTLKGYQIIPN